MNYDELLSWNVRTVPALVEDLRAELSQARSAEFAAVADTAALREKFHELQNEYWQLEDDDQKLWEAHQKAINTIDDLRAYISRNMTANDKPLFDND